ncbi:MAG: OST-HTH/LOTUS domain-containing protein, partial [Planctomycetota bacterium]|nr:OST-HTH/LOTUS domain-containing protein [Planctomycetota bacterium]
FLAAGPVKGARLKPIFVSEFERQSGESFARSFWSFPKFSDLLRSMPDLVEVIPPNGPGDITVRLWVTPSSVASPSSTASPVPAPIKFIPSPLWHAFTNPDPKRRRYYHRKTSDVIHYVDGDGSELGKAFAAKVATDPSYVEITPISPLEQSTWMQEFLSAQSLTERTRSSLDGITEVPYSSQINKAFAAALGERAGDWRSFRISKVHAKIQEWATRYGLHILQAVHTQEPAIAARPSETTALQKSEVASTSPIDAETRRLLHAVVDALEPRELANVLVPASVLSRIASAHH